MNNSDTAFLGPPCISGKTIGNLGRSLEVMEANRSATRSSYHGSAAEEHWMLNSISRLYHYITDTGPNCNMFDMLCITTILHEGKAF